MAQGNERLMRVIDSFLTQPKQSLSEVAAACDLGAPTTMRYLNDLVDHGWLEREESTKLYTLGVALVTIGGAARAGQPIIIRAMPVMKKLVAEFDETVNIAVKIRDEVVVLEALEGNQSIRGGARAGDKDQWFNSSLGKAILAHAPEQEVLDLFDRFPPQRCTPRTLMTTDAVLTDLAEVRGRGYALDDEESEIGLKCVGVPIWSGLGEVTHALSISGPTQRINNRFEEIIHLLDDASQEISRSKKESR